MLILQLNDKYRRRDGKVVTIKKLIPESGDTRYTEGYRFIDNHGNVYDANGRAEAGSTIEHMHDIVDAFDAAAPAIEVTDTSTTVEKLPGYFAIARERLRQHPVKVGVPLVASVALSGYGIYNYRDHGSVLPRGMAARRGGRPDVALRAAAAVGSFVSSVVKKFG